MERLHAAPFDDPPAVTTTTMERTKEFHDTAALDDIDTDDDNNDDAATVQKERLLGRLQGKLYERSQQEEILQQAYHKRIVEKHRAGVVLIAGKSGTGKTALATSSLRADRHHQEGWWVVGGKFDQLQRPEPYAAIVAAFTEYADLILAQDDVLLTTTIKASIVQAVGSEGRILTDMIPALEQIIGKQNQGTELEGQEAQNRFKFVFGMFLRAISSLERPLVLLLDDMQWADVASLDLLQEVATDTVNKGLLIVMTYRDSDVGPSHPFTKSVMQMEEMKVVLTKITLKNLKPESVNDLISDALLLPLQQTRALADIVYRHTDGNVFFVIQLLITLLDSGLLYSSGTTWRYDEDQVKAIDVETNVVVMLATRMKKLPALAQNALQVASCLGAEFREATMQLAFPCTVSPILRLLQGDGFVVQCRSKDVEYKFTHDRVQQAAYSLIGNKQEQARFHLNLGMALWKKSSRKEMAENLFVVVNQLNQGRQFLTDLEERNKVAVLNLKAGQKAMSLSAFPTAAAYLSHGIEFLGEDHWSREYDFSLAMYNASAEAEYCSANFERMDRRIDAVLSNGKSFRDKLRAQTTRVYALGTQDRLREAMALGFHILEDLGESFPSKTGKWSVTKQLYMTKYMLRGRSDADILGLPSMKDPDKIAAMQLMKLLVLYTYLGKPAFQPLVVLRMIQLSLKHGISAMSSVCFASYGMLLAGYWGKIQEGYRFGQLALALLDKFDRKEWRARVYCIVYGCTNHWVQPLRISLEKLQYANSVGMETGDIEYAVNDACVFVFNAFEVGRSLEKLEREARSYLEQMVTYRQHTWSSMTRPLCQVVSNLLGRSSDVTILTGEFMNQDRALAQAISKNFMTEICLINYLRLFLAYLFGDYDLAVEMGEKSQHAARDASGVYLVCAQCFFQGLANLAVAGKSAAHLSIARTSLKRMKKWAKHAPHNCLHKLLLLQAEWKNAKGDHQQTSKLYRQAIQAASRHGFIQHEAIACERLSLYLQERGETSEAETYSAQACSLYEKWGAVAKANQMRGIDC